MTHPEQDYLDASYDLLLTEEGLSDDKLLKLAYIRGVIDGLKLATPTVKTQAE